ncbi:MAG: hypothetical protein ACKVOO_02840 [Burkholderiaceae bacterium]
MQKINMKYLRLIFAVTCLFTFNLTAHAQDLNKFLDAIRQTQKLINELPSALPNRNDNQNNSPIAVDGQPVQNTAEPSSPTVPTRASTVLSESSGTRLRIELFQNPWPGNSIGRFEARSNGCRGQIAATTDATVNGELILRQDLEFGNCVPRCNFVIEKGLSSYRLECSGQVRLRGRFDQAANLNLLQDRYQTAISKEAPIAASGQTQVVTKNTESAPREKPIAELSNSSISSSPGEFTTRPQSSHVLLSETYGEKLSIDFAACQGGLFGGGKNNICGSSYNWETRECSGDIIGGEIRQDGALVFPEVTSRGNCTQRKCSIVLLPGWGQYQRICGNKIAASGRFDRGRNVEKFADRIDKSQFYKDPNVDRMAAVIPKPPYRLEHDEKKFVAAAAAIPRRASTFALRATTLPPEGLDLRDVLDALISVDSKAWKLDAYIPGSIQKVTSSKESSDTLVVDATLVHLSLLRNSSWVEDKVRVVFKANEMPCITYWNNSSCSADYALSVNPNADTRLSKEESACIENVTQEYSVEIPSSCLVWNAERRQCAEESPARYEKRQRQLWKNVCTRKLNVVFNCQLFRKSVAFEAGQTYAAYCALERQVQIK